MFCNQHGEAYPRGTPPAFSNNEKAKVMSQAPINVSDDFLDAALPGTLPSLAALRSKIHDLNLWHRHATGRIRCVLITGETGTGKYELAKTIVQHDQWHASAGESYRLPLLCERLSP